MGTRQKAIWGRPRQDACSLLNHVTARTATTKTDVLQLQHCNMQQEKNMEAAREKGQKVSWLLNVHFKTCVLTCCCCCSTVHSRLFASVCLMPRRGPSYAGQLFCTVWPRACCAVCIGSRFDGYISGAVVIAMALIVHHLCCIAHKKNAESAIKSTTGNTYCTS